MDRSEEEQEEHFMQEQHILGPCKRCKKDFFSPRDELFCEKCKKEPAEELVKFVPHDTCHGCGARGQDGGYFCKKCNTTLTDETKFNILGFWP